jgi:hypothetical protein
MKSDDALMEHAQTHPCAVKQKNQIIGITDEILNKFKVKVQEQCRGKRVSSERLTEGDKWRILYEVVFPNEAVPSPC